MDLDRVDTINWPTLVRPYGKAERALGQLACALETTSLHPTWLWREITRVSVLIAQAGGYQAKVDQLRLALIGAPVDTDDNTTGLAVAKRIFLASAPLFQKHGKTDSPSTLWPAFWDREGSNVLSDGEPPQADSDALPDDDVVDPRRAGEGARQRDRLITLARELAGFADDGRRPALINLLVDLRRHAATRHLPAQLVRIALPLALFEAKLVPRAAPGLLGGRRLPLGMSRAAASDKPLTDWLALGLGALAVEADQSYRRLAELTRQHQAWHAVLARTGLRRHALAPKALDLLAATPVLSIGLAARHLGCSHVAAGKIIERLSDLGILIEQTSRSRHKIFVAGDLPIPVRGEADINVPLLSSGPVTPIDVDGIAGTLDGLFADLDRLNDRLDGRVREGG